MRTSRLVYALFFLSGASGLIYQVVWVREFGNVFGNTIHSASLVIAVFMCGLGLGSYLAGRWADTHRGDGPRTLLRAYGVCELAIALLGLLVSLVLPQLGELAAVTSSYRQDANGWYVLSAGSYVARSAVAVVLLAPITVAMGATLTLLIRCLVLHDVARASWRIALLYGVNTLGAALGSALTALAFIPAAGLAATQWIAVLLNLIASLGALRLATGPPVTAAHPSQAPSDISGEPERAAWALPASGMAIAVSGFAAMGLELVWLRHLECLVGSFQSVFALVLTVVLCGMWLGAVGGGAMQRRFGRPVVLWAITQALFALTALVGLAHSDMAQMTAHVTQVGPAFLAGSEWRRAVVELWINARPILREVGLPAVLMGAVFPLANAVVQRREDVVGRRAGLLYLANTLGAVAGALVAGFLLLPRLGMQDSVSVLVGVGAIGLVPLAIAAWPSRGSHGLPPWPLAWVAAAMVAVSMGLAWWMTLPRDHLVARALWPLIPGERRLSVIEGLTEIVAVTEFPGGERRLMTNGFGMSATSLAAQRYMRAFAHLPLLILEAPKRVLVICFGVGSTAHAVSLHPSVRRLDIVDTSRQILGVAGSFAATNHDVLKHPIARVYVNDGRHHLRMQPVATYALITLEPPPISNAGVASLYSREFYALARSRLEPGGMLTQWLPAYQVPGETVLSMVRAFVDVFPQSVLLSGFGAELILLGVNGPTAEIDPARLDAKLRAAPAVRADLARVQLDGPLEIIGTFAASGAHLDRVSEPYLAVTDARPLPEYAVASRLVAHRLPAELFDVTGVTAWCPTCVTHRVEGLPSYLGFLAQIYRSPLFLEYRSVRTGRGGPENLPPLAAAAHPYFAALVADLAAKR